MDLIGFNDAAQPVRAEPEERRAPRPVSGGSPDELLEPSLVGTVAPSTA
ncbi:hypothetical protein [Actinacidiphila glaucinigra]